MMLSPSASLLAVGMATDALPAIGTAAGLTHLVGGRGWDLWRNRW
jgi:hypothetical protein